MSLESSLTSKRKTLHRGGGVGFKNVPDDEKPMTKAQEEKHMRFLKMRHEHYHNEYIKGKDLPPLEDDDDDGEAAAKAGASPSTRK
ncbi:hypothetical protein MTO96_048434 [Rhipicephalus appendiculatus]